MSPRGPTGPGGPSRREGPGPIGPGAPGTPVPRRPGGPGGPGPRPRRRRSRGERILRWALLVVAILLVLVAAGYGYVRYRWGQVKSQACATCTAVGSGQPFNVLLVGSDSRAGNTGQAAQNFGSASQVGGQRSDTIKILHVDPSSGSASLLSIPRDTYVQMPSQLSGQGLGGDQKINTAFNDGADALIQTIQDSLGIPIAHFVEVDFQGLTNAVNTLGGIYLNFPYPVRDNDNGNNNSGLVITHTGCQKLNGSQTLALARSRFYQYDEYGYWHYDPTSDLGRIERQNIVIQAIASRAHSTYNPLTLNAFLGGVVHDVTVDKGMSFGTMFSLATTYHAFSPSSLKSYTLPTVTQSSARSGSVQVVSQPQAQQVLTQFLGSAPGTATTPPVNAYGNAVQQPSSSSGSSGAGAASGTSGSSSSSGSGTSGSTTSGAAPSSTAPPYDPTVCSG
ncbi:MAG TPA: hypothetical protein DCQ30_04350 [Acidimicrobiaceae bacterium]|nr:hypothetical protein [Acidimicrobiaceae bacterium]